MDFDYARAWNTLAAPAFAALSADDHALVEAVCIETETGWTQNHVLLLTPDPYDPTKHATALARFDSISTVDLGRLARVVNTLGHWRPGGTSYPLPGGYGAHWHFANLADQVIVKRLGIGIVRGVAHRTSPSGEFAFAVLDGALRIAYANRACWLWHEIGFASEETLVWARRELGRLRHKHDKINRTWISRRADAGQQIIEAIRASALARMPESELAWFDLTRYTTSNVA